MQLNGKALLCSGNTAGQKSELSLFRTTLEYALSFEADQGLANFIRALTTTYEDNNLNKLLSALKKTPDCDIRRNTEKILDYLKSQ